MGLRATTPERDSYLKRLGEIAPKDTAAKGSRLLDTGSQGLINEQLADSAYDDAYKASDHQDVMRGVGNTMGLLTPSDSLSQDMKSLGMAVPADFADSLTRRAQRDTDRVVRDLKREDELMAPLRLSQRQQRASKNLAMNESLRMNNWALWRQQYQQAQQLQLMREQQKASFLGSLLGLLGTGLGAAAGAAIPGGSAAVGAAIGGTVGGTAGRL